MNHIGIFIFVGLLSVVFNENGWFPNQNMYAISQLVYNVVLPSFIAYAGGLAVGEKEGGIVAVLAVTGLMLEKSSAVLLGAMLVGPLAGSLWKKVNSLIEKKAPSSMQMLIANLCLGITGGIFAAAGMYLFLPVLNSLMQVAFYGISFLMQHKMTALLSVIIEPLKVFFLNNIMNHSILVPLGMAQVQETGKSVLFLLESNPGPGMGVLAGLFCAKKISKNEGASVLAAHALGGIHEVYFPFVLANMKLLAALIMGGMAGNICFSILDEGLEGVVSPGSILIILLMAGPRSILKVLAGVCLSAVVAFLVSMMLLSEKKEEKKTEMTEHKKQEKIMQKSVKSIAYVCDGGMGSSAMGAALLRRKMASLGISGIRVEAFAADMVPEDMDIIVCQRDYYSIHGEFLENRNVYLVENLLHVEECMELLRKCGWNEG